jgi:hypothetical protein
MRKGQDVGKPQNKIKGTRDNISTPAQVRQLLSHNRYRQKPSTNKDQNTKSTTIKINLDIPNEYKYEHVKDNNDSNLDKQAHIKGTEDVNRHDTPNTIPTSQPTKTVGREPTVAAGRQPATTPTHADIITLLPRKKRYRKTTSTIITTHHNQNTLSHTKHNKTNYNSN